MSSNARYKQVYEALKAVIYNGYEDGALLPPETELMQTYNVSRTTLRHAISLLRNEGILEVKQGLGTKITLGKKMPNNNFLLFHNVKDIAHYLPNCEDRSYSSILGGIIDIIPSNEKIANALQIKPGTPVYRLERMMTLNDKPMILCRNYFKCDIFPGLEEYSGKIEYICDVYTFFEWKYKVVFGSAKQIITAQLASFFDSNVLDVEPQSALLLLSRTSISTNGDVFEFTEWLTNPNLICIQLTMEGARKYPAPNVFNK